MVNNCVNLNFNIHPIPVDDHVILRQSYQHPIDFRRLNPLLISILKSVNLCISYSESFRSKPHYDQLIHTDDVGGDYVKLNWAYGGANSTMSWYKINPETPQPDIRGTKELGTPYLLWDNDQVELIETATVGFPSIVQVGCPHNVTNYEEERLCISLLIRDITTRKRSTMEQACERLSSYIQ